MKKTIKICMFLALFMSFINHSFAFTPEVAYLNDIYSNRIGPDKTYSGQMGYIRIYGKLVYCYEPFKIVGKDGYYIDNYYFDRIDKDKLMYMQLVAHYSKNFIDNNNNWFYYMAAQELIWEQIIGSGTVYYTTGPNGSGNIINIDSYKNEINNYTTNFLKKPSFDGTTIKDNFFSTVILEDKNNVLQNYEIINNSKNQVWKNDNKLYIKILSSEESKIKLVRKLNGKGLNYYRSNTNQDLMLLDDDISYESDITIGASNEYTSSLVINFLDKKLNNLIDKNIEFKIVNLDNNEETEIFNTANGIYYSEQVFKEGKYKIELINVPKNYVIDDPLTFEIKEGDTTDGLYRINDYLEKAIGKIYVENLSNNNHFTLYAAADITDGNVSYKKDELIEEFDIEKDGIFIIDKLPLGKYYILDPKTNKKYIVNLKYIDAKTKEVISYIEIEDTLDDDKINESNKINNIKNNDVKKTESQDLYDKENINEIKEELPNTVNYIKIISIIGLIVIIIYIYKNEK